MMRTALHDQAMRALESGDLVPGYTLSAGRAERHWGDESAAAAALYGLGLARDDVVAEAMRSPKQVELRAKADGASSCGRFPQHSKPFKEEDNHEQRPQTQARSRQPGRRQRQREQACSSRAEGERARLHRTDGTHGGA
jgi:hypothetical protein